MYYIMSYDIIILYCIALYCMILNFHIFHIILYYMFMLYYNIWNCIMLYHILLYIYICMYVCIYIYRETVHIYRQYSFDQAVWLHISITTDYPFLPRKTAKVLSFVALPKASVLGSLQISNLGNGTQATQVAMENHGRLFIQLNGSKWAMFHSYHTYVPLLDRSGW